MVLIKILSRNGIVMYGKQVLSEQVAGDLKQMILNKDLQPGDKLPNELVLTQQLNVSRSTVREAIKILRSENILEVRRGLGTFVCETPGLKEDPFGIDFMEESSLLMDFYEVRLVVEPSMAHMAAERASDEELQQIKKAYREVKKAIEGGLDHTEPDIHFHNLIAAATHNPIMQRILPVINEGIKSGYEKTKDVQESGTKVLRQHKRIMEALMDRLPEEAEKAMKKHIKYGMDQINRES